MSLTLYCLFRQTVFQGLKRLKTKYIWLFFPQKNSALNFKKSQDKYSSHLLIVTESLAVRISFAEKMSCRYEIFSHYMVLKYLFDSATHLTDWETQHDSTSWKRRYIVPASLTLMAPAAEAIHGSCNGYFSSVSFYNSFPCLLLGLLEGTSELKTKSVTKQHPTKLKYISLAELAACGQTPFPSFAAKPSGQTMSGHVLSSLSAFNSQLTALIAAAPCLLLNPGAILPPESDYNSLCWDTAVHLPPTDEAGWAATSISAEARCSFSQHATCWPASACVFKA